MASKEREAHFNCPNCRCPLEATTSSDGNKLTVKIDRRVTDAMYEMTTTINHLFAKIFDPKLWRR